MASQAASTRQIISAVYDKLKGQEFEGTYDGPFTMHEKVWQTFTILNPSSELKETFETIFSEFGRPNTECTEQVWKGLLPCGKYEGYRLFAQVDTLKDLEYTTRYLIRSYQIFQPALGSTWKNKGNVAYAWEAGVALYIKPIKEKHT